LLKETVNVQVQMIVIARHTTPTVNARSLPFSRWGLLLLLLFGHDCRYTCVSLYGCSTFSSSVPSSFSITKLLDQERPPLRIRPDWSEKRSNSAKLVPFVPFAFLRPLK
jgi:hypothetical protein